MSRPGASPSFGDVVLVKDLPDTNGVNIKPIRPCVVVSPTAEVGGGGPIAIVAISTLLPGPVPPDAVLLHSIARGARGRVW